MNFVRDVWAVLLILISTAIVVAIGVVAAKARDNGQWADAPEHIRQWFRSLEIQERISVLEIAGDPFDIAVGPLYLNDGATPCLRCVRPKMQQMWWDTDETVSALRKVNSKSSPLRRVNAWQSAPSLSAIAGIAANEALSLASGYSEPGLVGRRLNISLQTYETRIDDFERDAHCSWCAAPSAPDASFSRATERTRITRRAGVR